MSNCLDPCQGCQKSWKTEDKNCKYVCNEYIMKNTFYSKIDECYNNFFDYFETKNKKKLGFKESVVLREFASYLKQNT